MSNPVAAPTTTVVKGKDFPAMLEKFSGEIARALPRHLSSERMCRIALTSFRRNPKLAECDPRSVFAALIQAAQLGLEPDTLGRAYLIPYEKRQLVDGQWKTVAVECQFIPGWKGLIELMNRSGLGTAWTGAAYAGDTFDFALGDSPHVNHVPRGAYSDDKLQHVYAVGRPKGCEWPIIEVWTIDRVLAHRDRYNKVGKRHYSYENQEMYARKVVLLQVLKYMPLSPDLIRTMELSNAAEDPAGQGLTIEGAIDGSWVPPPAEQNGEQALQAPAESSDLNERLRAKAGATSTRKPGEQGPNPEGEPQP
jgi:recombination protein RecT